MLHVVTNVKTRDFRCAPAALVCRVFARETKGRKGRTVSKKKAWHLADLLWFLMHLPKVLCKDL